MPVVSWPAVIMVAKLSIISASVRPLPFFRSLTVTYLLASGSRPYKDKVRLRMIESTLLSSLASDCSALARILAATASIDAFDARWERIAFNGA